MNRFYPFWFPSGVSLAVVKSYPGKEYGKYRGTCRGFSTVIKNTRAIKEFAGDLCSSFLQQFAKGGAAFPAPGASASCGGASESAEKITLGMPGQ